MNILKWQTEEKFLANMMLLSSGLWSALTGYYLLTDGSVSLSLTYKLMTGLLPLHAWGVVMILTGAFLCAAIFQIGRLRFISMIAGGLLGTLMVGLYAMASAEGAINYLVPMRYALAACFNLLIAVLGGVGIWRIRQGTSRI